MYNLLLVWAALVGVAVFVLYMRDPYAVGRHRLQWDNTVRKLSNGLRTVCSNLRSRGLCPMS